MKTKPVSGQKVTQWVRHVQQCEHCRVAMSKRLSRASSANIAKRLCAEGAPLFLSFMDKVRS